MRFKYGIIFGIIVLIFILAGCGMVQPSKETNSPNSQSSASEKEGKATGIPSSPPVTPKAGKSILTSIQMIDANSGWASTQASILRTTDGGLTWSDVTPKGIANLPTARSLGADSQTAWVGTTQKSPPKIIVYHTKDGGKSWGESEINPPQPADITSLSFPDLTHGWLLASYGAAAGSEQVEVFRTSDGGGSWQTIASAGPNREMPNGLPFGGDKTGLVFADQKNGWMTGSSPVNSAWLYTTHDGGLTWVSQNIPIPNVYHTEGGGMITYSPHFSGPKVGILPVFFNVQTPTALVFYMTRNGGMSWKATTALPCAQESLQKQFRWSILDAAHAFASDGYKLYYTSNGANSFVSITPNINLQNLQQLDFISEQLGWAIVGGNLWETADGGKTWSILTNI